jgi:hypothetical protein
MVWILTTARRQRQWHTPKRQGHGQDQGHSQAKESPVAFGKVKKNQELRLRWTLKSRARLRWGSSGKSTLAKEETTYHALNLFHKYYRYPAICSQSLANTRPIKGGKLQSRMHRVSVRMVRMHFRRTGHQRFQYRWQICASKSLEAA